MNYMLIYCNGDSFTAGAELSDDIFPFWPGVSSDKQMTAVKKQFIEMKKSLAEKWVDLSTIDIATINAIPKLEDKRITPHFCQFNYILTEINKYRAWPKHLSLIDTSIEVINSARGGAGITGICQRTVSDLIALRQKNKQVDLVVLQLTGSGRQEIYDHREHDEFMYERLIIAEKNHWHYDGDFEIAQTIFKKYDDKDYMIKYLYTLSSAVEAIKSLTGQYPLLIHGTNKFYIEKDIDNLEQHYKIRNIDKELERLNSLIDGSRIKQTFPVSLSDVAEKLKFPYCVEGHFQEDAHKNFAKIIYENICLR